MVRRPVSRARRALIRSGVRLPPELIAMCLAAAACFSPQIPEGSTCTTVCPGELSCVNGRCVLGAAEIDAGAGLDAGLDASAACPSGYVSYVITGSQYRVVGTPASQASAVADCADDGAGTYLVIPDNPVENGLVDSLANEDSWLGITDAARDLTWVTVLGTPQTYFEWAQGQPDGGAAESCVFLRDGRWQDAACALARPYICECR